MAAASVELTALGTTAVLWTSDDAALPDAATELLRELDAVDRACSRFRDDSELTLLNQAQGKPFVASHYLFEAVRVSLRAAAATGGLVDPTIGRGLRLAGYDRTFTLVRGRDPLTVRARFVPAAGWRLVQLDTARRSIRIPSGVELDLGATAKALAADRAATAAADATGAGILVSLGGDIAVAGPAPAGGWPVRIAEDRRRSLDGPVVALESGGLATSSVTGRRWRTAEHELHHILDPRTGRPAPSCWRTVSVAAASCVDANTASTAAVLLGDAAPTWLAERRLPARLVSVSGEIVRISGWPDDAELAA
jgi:thiamine biosynthesis lipoprotein